MWFRIIMHGRYRYNTDFQLILHYFSIINYFEKAFNHEMITIFLLQIIQQTLQKSIVSYLALNGMLPMKPVVQQFVQRMAQDGGIIAIHVILGGFWFLRVDPMRTALDQNLHLLEVITVVTRRVVVVEIIFHGVGTGIKVYQKIMYG